MRSKGMTDSEGEEERGFLRGGLSGHLKQQKAAKVLQAFNRNLHGF